MLFVRNDIPAKVTGDFKVHGANMGPTWILSDPDAKLIVEVWLQVQNVLQSIHWRSCIWVKVYMACCYAATWARETIIFDLPTFTTVLWIHYTLFTYGNSHKRSFYLLYDITSFLTRSFIVKINPDHLLLLWGDLSNNTRISRTVW